ncbi:MAG: hypothetical protein ACLPGW_10110 [Roseiarcus sp.]
MSKKKHEKTRLSPIATTLCRVTGELRKVAARLEKVQHAVGRLVFDSASPRSAHFHDLQDIDRATQEIIGIAAFLEKLASDVPAHWLADSKGASLSIALHELASNLGRHEESEAEPKEPVVIHEYEIFD